MANYARTLDRLVRRALRNADGDLEAAFEQASDLGMSITAMEERLIADLQTGGPIFGKFFTSLMGGAEQSVLSAQRQGTMVGRAQERDPPSLGDLSDDDWTRLGNGENPDAMEAFERIALDDELVTWVAALVNTCQYCLPLHGSTQRRSDWREQGLDPETIHSDNGFNSPCYCMLVADEDARPVDNAELIDPLRREKLESKSGLKGNRRTARSVTQKDPGKAADAVDKATETLGGRRTVRLLGQVNKEEGE